MDNPREQLRAWRKAARLTLKATAERAGFKSPSIVCEWESGERHPSYEAALAIERMTKRKLRVEAWGYDRSTARRLAA